MLHFKHFLRCERVLRRQIFTRLLSTTQCNNLKVAVIGAAGGIGQPLSMLLMQNPLVTRLALYDVSPKVAGVAEDISHFNTDICVEGGFYGPEGVGHALCCASVVVIPAGKPRTPSMSREDLFNVNAQLIADMATACVSFCPCALLAIITNPVNSMVPIAYEMKNRCNVGTPDKIFGVTTLDLVRASTFVGREFYMDPASIFVPVVGGHSGTTIVPLLSQCAPSVAFTDSQILMLTHMIQNAGTEVVKAKAGAGSATLSMAFSAARFVNSLLRGLTGQTGVIEYAYVMSDLTQASFFASPICLGTQGISKILTYSKVSDFEKDLIDKAIPQLQKEIEQGVKFAKKC